jgi:hypothetical protein
LILSAVAISLVLVASVLAGCGSDSASSEPAITRQAFVKKANAICEASKVRALEVSGGPNGLRKGVIPAIETAIAEVEALPQPDGDEAQIKAAMADLQTALDQAKADKDLVAIPEMEPLMRQAAPKARSYGIDACAYG